MHQTIKNYKGETPNIDIASSQIFQTVIQNQTFQKRLEKGPDGGANISVNFGQRNFSVAFPPQTSEDGFHQ